MHPGAQPWPVNRSDGCFVAGTLVHTKEGLKPIEQIKVGDWVLSKPESGEGEQAYKRVVKTFKFEDNKVYRVTWYTKDALDAADASEDLSLREDDIQTLVATGNHPFWVKGLGWIRLDRLEYRNELELGDGRIGIFEGIDPIYQTATEGVGWVPEDCIEPVEGWPIDLRDGNIIRGKEKVFNDNDDVDWENGEGRLQPTVYNFEVEDYHTYYVGELGVWVHNTDCGGDIARARRCAGQHYSESCSSCVLYFERCGKSRGRVPMKMSLLLWERL